MKTTAVDPALQRAVRRAAVAATRATSVLDTQPWRMVVRRDAVEIHADRSRQLRHLDFDSRSLVFSCGSALINLRLSLSAAGLGARVNRFPDAHRPDFIAVVHVEPERPPADDPFDSALRIAAVDRVCRAPTKSMGDPAALVPAPSVLAVRPHLRASVEALVRRAVDRVRADPSAHAEMRPVWLAAATVHGPEAQVASIDSLGVVLDPCDSRDGWLRAGERYQLMTLDAALTGVSTVAVLPVTAYPDLRTALRGALRLSARPHLLFRAAVAVPAPPRPRRRLVDTLVEGT